MSVKHCDPFDNVARIKLFVPFSWLQIITRLFELFFRVEQWFFHRTVYVFSAWALWTWPVRRSCCSLINRLCSCILHWNFACHRRFSLCGWLYRIGLEKPTLAWLGKVSNISVKCFNWWLLCHDRTTFWLLYHFSSFIFKCEWTMSVVAFIFIIFDSHPWLFTWSALLVLGSAF